MAGRVFSHHYTIGCIKGISIASEAFYSIKMGRLGVSASEGMVFTIGQWMEMPPFIHFFSAS